jgi:hypothetical protein
MTQHKWVKHTVTNVSTLPDLDDDRQVVVIEDPADVEAAEEGAVYGCDVCGCILEGNTDSLCPGPSVVDQFGVSRAEL